jgi:hypothetical protein
MADRYQDRPFPADDDYHREAEQSRAKGEGDPLAELARLIGQADPFANLGRDNPPLPPRGEPRMEFERPAEYDEAPAGPPPWMQRAAAHEAPTGQFESVHPLQRYAAAHREEPEFHQAPSFAVEPDLHQQADPDRYDDALYGHADGHANGPEDSAYPDDHYGDQYGYSDEADEHVSKSRRGGMMMAAVVLALAVVGTGAAFAYRTYVGSPRSGEPPIIKADTGPNKIIPSTGDGAGKLIQDRLAGGSGEQLVSREEQPVNVQDSTKGGPRVVFPPLNQNANPPTASSVAPGNRPAPIAGNGTMSGDEPRKIRTLTVRGDQPDPSATPIAKQPPAAPKQAAVAPAPARIATAPSNANASANAPLSLSPQAAPAPAQRVASTTAAPQQIAPAVSSGGGYVVQVSSQRNEADAQASFRALQGKFPSVLGSRAPLIKRADLGDKGVYYRAMVGPFGSPDEASQFCGSLKTAGGQCVVQRN